MASNLVGADKLLLDAGLESGRLNVALGLRSGTAVEDAEFGKTTFSYVKKERKI